jgi:hypothetical protein
MKNHKIDRRGDAKRCFHSKNIRNEGIPGLKIVSFEKSPITLVEQLIYSYYFSWYITSFTSFTVRATLGSAPATRFGA